MRGLAVVSLIPAVVAVVIAVAAQSSVVVDAHDLGVRMFLGSIADYLTLRQRLFQPLPPLNVTNDGQQIHVAVEARAAALHVARAHAQMGDVFNSTVSALFRSRIRDAFAAAHDDPARLLAEMTEDGDTVHPPVVKGRFSWSTGCATPPAVLAALPSLPEELQYRFVGVDLALVDTEASYIVDVLPNALVFGASEPSSTHRSH